MELGLRFGAAARAGLPARSAQGALENLCADCLPLCVFTEGVVVAHKDKHQIKNHEEIKVEGAATCIPNVQVTQLMKSLKSRGFVTESFSWQWYYYYLSNEGIEYLRDYLHLPAEVMPNTLKKQAAKPQGRPGGYQGEGGFSDDPKKAGAPGEYRPAFGGGEGGGGFGRGGGGGGFGRGGGGGGFGRGGGGEGGGFGRGGGAGRGGP